MYFPYFLSSIFFSLALLKVYSTYYIQSMSHQLFMLSVRHPVSRRLLTVSRSDFEAVKCYICIFNSAGDQHPICCLVQRSTVFRLSTFKVIIDIITTIFAPVFHLTSLFFVLIIIFHFLLLFVFSVEYFI